MSWGGFNNFRKSSNLARGVLIRPFKNAGISLKMLFLGVKTSKKFRALRARCQIFSPAAQFVRGFINFQNQILNWPWGGFINFRPRPNLGWGGFEVGGGV